VPELSDALGLPIALALGAVLVVWYVAGNELMRRRAHRLALWSRRIVEPLGGRQSIRWLSGQAFRLEVDGAAQAPFRSLHLTGLIESWDVPMVWAWNRLHGRRDMILVQATLRAQPLWGLEVYRPGTVLAGDSRHLARQEGWTESQLDDLQLATAGDVGSQLAAELVERLDAERARLIRLAVRRQAPHLTLALNVPDPNRFDPQAVRRLTQRLAERIIS
jgi:hypothetical protein